MLGAEQQAALSRLDELYSLLQRLGAKPSHDDLTKFGAFFTSKCTTNLKSMREETKHGRQAATDDLRDSLDIWHLDERRVDAQSAVVNGDSSITVFCQMSNRICILGDILDPYPETAVVRFVRNGNNDSDLSIDDFKMYGCRSAIVQIVQAKTAKGPYSVSYMEKGERLPGMQAKT